MTDRQVGWLLFFFFVPWMFLAGLEEIGWLNFARYCSGHTSAVEMAECWVKAQTWHMDWTLGPR